MNTAPGTAAFFALSLLFLALTAFAGIVPGIIAMGALSVFFGCVLLSDIEKPK